MIEISHVYKTIGKKDILCDINCVLHNGIYGLLGLNGSGKTTLLRCITNYYSLSNGSINIDGVPAHKIKNNIRIGYLPQSFGVFKELSVYDMMKYFCNIKGVLKKERENEIMRCLCSVNMEGYMKKKAGELSYGMVRRIGIAQALLNKPKLVIFDEPTAGLDLEERMRFKTIISNLGINETVIVSTHIVEDLDACCDNVVVMDKGRILCIEACEEISKRAYKRVIACEKGKENMITCKYFITKRFYKDGKIYYRVLLENETWNNDYEELEPTVEDGYMMLLKKL